MFGSQAPDPEAKRRKTSEKLFESLGDMYGDQKRQDQFIQLASMPVSQGFSNGELSEAMGRGESAKISDALCVNVTINCVTKMYQQVKKKRSFS